MAYTGRMSSAKQQIMAFVQEMPDDASTERILYELQIKVLIEERLKEADEGKFVSHEEVKERMASWLKSFGSRAR